MGLVRTERTTKKTPQTTVSGVHGAKSGWTGATVGRWFSHAKQSRESSAGRYHHSLKKEAQRTFPKKTCSSLTNRTQFSLSTRAMISTSSLNNNNSSSSLALLLSTILTAIKFGQDSWVFFLSGSVVDFFFPVRTVAKEPFPKICLDNAQCLEMASFFMTLLVPPIVSCVHGRSGCFGYSYGSDATAAELIQLLGPSYHG